MYGILPLIPSTVPDLQEVQRYVKLAHKSNEIRLKRTPTQVSREQLKVFNRGRTRWKTVLEGLVWQHYTGWIHSRQTRNRKTKSGSSGLKLSGCGINAEKSGCSSGRKTDNNGEKAWQWNHSLGKMSLKYFLLLFLLFTYICPFFKIKFQGVYKTSYKMTYNLK